MTFTKKGNTHEVQRNIINLLFITSFGRTLFVSNSQLIGIHKQGHQNETLQRYKKDYINEDRFLKNQQKKHHLTILSVRQTSKFGFTKIDTDLQSSI